MPRCHVFIPPLPHASLLHTVVGGSLSIGLGPSEGDVRIISLGRGSSNNQLVRVRCSGCPLQRAGESIGWVAHRHPYRDPMTANKSIHLAFLSRFFAVISGGSCRSPASSEPAPPPPASPVFAVSRVPRRTIQRLALSSAFAAAAAVVLPDGKRA